jgi:cell division protein FtsW
MNAPARPAGYALDPVLFGAVSSLLLLGLVAVASASMALAERDLGRPFYYLERQGVFAVGGTLLALGAFVVPTKLWRGTGFVLMSFALALLVLVLVPGVGHEVNGAVRWLPIGPVGVQVSEVARLFLLMYLAGYVVRRQAELSASFAGFLKPMLVIGAACALLLAEPDFGAATVLLITSLGVLFLGGVRWRDFGLLFVCAAAAMALLAIASPYRMQRLTSFLHPWEDPYASGFQLTQSLIAIGRGGWFGVGLGGSVQKLFYLPEAHTDFVFAVLAEETGLTGVMITLLLYGLLVARGFAIARRASEAGLAYQGYLAFGISLWLGLQSAINIGVNMGVLPTKGLTLPLLSYGGSSLAITLLSCGLLLRVHHETCAATGAIGRERGRRA